MYLLKPYKELIIWKIFQALQLLKHLDFNSPSNLNSTGRDRSWTGDYAAILRTTCDSRTFPTCSWVMTGVSRTNQPS